MCYCMLASLAMLSLCPAEMKELHVYRNYSAGEPSTRLYVKNLAKQVDEKVGVAHGRKFPWN